MKLGCPRHPATYPESVMSSAYAEVAPHPTPLPASGEREGPAEREGEGQRATDCCSEPLNRTAVGVARASTPWSGRDEDVDTRVKPAQDDDKQFHAVSRQVDRAKRFS